MEKKGTIIMTVSGKGGTGKSCLTATIGRELARFGQRTLLVEMEPGPGIFDLMLNLGRGICGLSDLLSGDCEEKDCLLPVPEEPGLWAILSPQDPGFVYKPQVFANQMQQLAESFDFILIETPSGEGSWFEAAVLAADRAIILVTPDLPCLRQGRSVSDRLDQKEGLGQSLVINRLDVKEFCRRRPFPHLDYAIDTVGAQLLGIVPEDREFAHRLSTGAVLPHQNGARAACSSIARRILGQSVELGL